MNKMTYGIVISLGTALLFTGCCKKGDDEQQPTSPIIDTEPEPSGATITGSSALEKLKAKGYTPITDPVVGENGGIKSTAVVLKPDLITVNIIEYPDANMAKLAASGSASVNDVLTHLSGKTVIRVTCVGKPKDKCEAIMSTIKD